MRRYHNIGLLWLLAVILLFVPCDRAMAGTGGADHTTYDYQDKMDWPEAPEISAASAYMIELNSGAVLYNKNGDAKSFPASTTKIMTALLALENCSLDEEVTFSHNAIYDIEEGGHHWEFEEGEVLTVDECLQFLLCESVNEVGYALAEHMAGSISDFAEMMNARAAELGATGTHFNNPHGLNDEDHYTTARDMALILWGCVQNEKFVHYCSLPSVSLAGHVIRTEGFSTYTNHHLMLREGSDYYDPDVVCGKTGYTSIAGNTLVTYASRGDMDVVCVLMQGLSDRFDDTRKLLDYAFDNFTVQSSTALTGSDGGNGYLRLRDKGETGVCLPNSADWSKVSFSLKADETSGLVRVWNYGDVTLQKAPVELLIGPDKASEEEAVSGEEGDASGETAEETESAAPAPTKPFVEEKAAEAPEGFLYKEILGWSVLEIAAIFGFAVLFMTAFVLIIVLIRVRHQRKRERRRASYMDDEE